LILKPYTSILIILLVACYLSCGEKNNKNEATTVKQDTLSINKTTVSKANQKTDLDRTYQTAIREDNDSLKGKLLLDLSFRYLKLKDSIMFLRVNKQARYLTISLKDSVGTAETYWDLAQFYHTHNREDSAYFYYDKAQKIYRDLGDHPNSGSLLLNMAIIQKNIRDYTGSEVTTTNAIRLLKPLDKFKLLYQAYNNLGIVSNELEEYDKAIFYYEKGIAYIEKSRANRYLPSIWNNLGLVYHNQGNYKKAIEYFQKALSFNEDIEESNPKLYAMLIDNEANAKLHLGDTVGVYNQFIKALKLREDIDVKAGISINQLHLADYFLLREDTANAINYALAAKKVSSNSQNTRDLLASLDFLSLVVKDSALRFTKRYVAINDSLQKRERAVRNKFARIRFETNEYISETERLNKQMIRISIISLTVFLIFVLLYIIKDQRSKNKLISQKQKAGQEIYNLVLSQQKIIEEEREREKQRISRELHDGILGSLFGLRISLDSLNDDDDKESKKKRAEYIREIQKIAEEIRLIAHQLNKDSQIDVDFTLLLEQFLSKQPEGINIQLIIPHPIDWESIEDNIKINSYRIIQEAITNAIRHSQATAIELLINQLENRLVIEIRDNGKGFDTKKSTMGIGLKNMKNRSRTMKGKLSIKSGTEGTLIKLVVKL